MRDFSLLEAVDRNDEKDEKSSSYLMRIFNLVGYSNGIRASTNS